MCSSLSIQSFHYNKILLDMIICITADSEFDQFISTGLQGCFCVPTEATILALSQALSLALSARHLESLGSGSCRGCLLGVPGGWSTWLFISSEKSCLITSKKLLNGLPRYTDGKRKKKEKEKERTGKQMNNGLYTRRNGQRNMKR